MSNKTIFRPLISLVPLAFLAACTGMRGPDVAPTVAPPVTVTSGTPDLTVTEPLTPVETPVAPPPPPPPPPANPAVVALLDRAHADASAGQLPAASAAIERALRIEPRNPVLWQELAMLKLKKGEYQQAENFAARSNSWAGSNKPLLAKNWRIISEARSSRGDNAGAKAALARAKALDPSSAE